MIWVGLLLLVALLVATSDKPEGAWVWVGAAGIVWAIRSWRRRRSYPEARSKAHGATRELLRSAQAKERELFALEPRLLSDGSMEEWSKWERVCSDAGLSGATLQRIETTPTGWALQVELRSGGTLEQVESAKGALESALDERRGAITLEQGERARVVLLKIQEREPDTAPLSWPGPPRSASIYDDVQLGAYIDHDGGPLSHPLYGQHVLISGASGSGKSVTLNIEVAHVANCRDAVMVGCDLKGGAELGPWAHAFQSLATTRETSEELLAWVVEMLEHRGPLLPARGLRTWQCTPHEPAIVVFIDEHARLSYSKPAIRAIEQILEQGRGLGIIYVGCLQKPSVGGLGSNRISPNISVKIVHRVASVTEVGVAMFPGAKADGWDADEIPKSQKGVLYLHGPEAEHPRLARAFFATDAKVKAAAGRLGTARPAPPPARRAAPAELVPPDDTNRDESDGSGGGEQAPHEALRRLLQSPDGISDAALAERLEMSLAWVKKWRGNYGAVQVERGLWRLP